MVEARKISAILLNSVTATGSSAEQDMTELTYATFFIEASSITTGGTMKIQTKAPSGNWIDLDSRVISANGSTVVTLEGSYQSVRANLTARTDGTYTVSMTARP